MPRRFLVFCALILGNRAALAQLSPPTIVSSRPLGASAGETFSLEVNGTDLDGVNILTFEELHIHIDHLEAKKTQVKAKVTVPGQTATGPFLFRLAGPKGISNAGHLFVGESVKTIAEIEPNRGFRKPQTVQRGDAIEGKIEPGDDVDVYAIEMKPGEILSAAVFAARVGSGLDSLLTIFGPDGRELGEADDTAGKDAELSIRARRAGRYFVQVQDADGKNRDPNIEKQKSRPYRLELTASPRRVEPFEIGEVEPNDDERHAQVLTLPGAWNARLDRIGDFDTFRLVAPPGAEGLYRISALAAKIGSTADPVLAALDDSGETQQENDDASGRDPQLVRSIDAKGLLVSVRDYHGRGGERFIYRLEVDLLPPRAITVTTDFGARAVPRGGSIALPVSLDRRNDGGPITLLAGETPYGVSVAPLTIAKGQNSDLLIISARDDAPLGRFSFRLTARDSGASVSLAYRERMAIGGSEPPEGWLTVVEPATLGIQFEPAEIALAPGGKTSVKIVLDRRGEAAKSSAVKLRFVPVDGLEPITESTVAKGSDSTTVEFKVKGDALPGPRRLIVLARFESSAEALAVAASLTVFSIKP